MINCRRLCFSYHSLYGRLFFDTRISGKLHLSYKNDTISETAESSQPRHGDHESEQIVDYSVNKLVNQ